MNASLLVYDIPDNARIPNPSGRLRRIAVRANLSVWIIRDSDVPWTLVNELIEAGAKVDIVKFDVSEAAHLVRMALAAMQVDVEKAAQRMQAAIARRDTAMTDALNGGEIQDIGAYTTQCNLSIKKYEKLLVDFKAAAERFEIDPQFLKLDEAAQMTRSIRLAIQTKAAAYVYMCEQIAYTSASLAAAASKDLVPAGVLADYLEERGIDVEQQRLTFADDNHTTV